MKLSTPHRTKTSLVFAISLALTPWLLSQHATAQIGSIGNFTDGTNVLTNYNGPGDWDHGSSNLLVGHTAEGIMFVFGGSEVINAQGTLGQNAGVNGEATINGAGSKWTNNTGTFVVGRSGVGILDIQDGGEVTGFRGVIANSTNGMGTVTLTNGSKWTNSEHLRLAGGGNTNATMNIESGSTVSNVNGTIGFSGGSTSTSIVNVSGGSLWTNSNDLSVGASGLGTLNVNTGGKVASVDGLVGGFGSSTGNATINGAGSQWTNSGEVTVGFDATGNLKVEDGALITSTRAIIAERANSTGTATVRGNGAHWENSSDFFVGGSSTAAGGDGTLNIQNGGSVTVDTTMLVWDSGTVNLTGGQLNTFRLDLTDPTSPTNFNMTGGRLEIGDEILGTFQQDGGTLASASVFTPVDMTDDLIMNAGEIEFELGGNLRGFGYDAFDIAGSALLDGTITVILDPAFDPVLNNSFLLIDANSYSRTTSLLDMFDFTGAGLDPGLAWDTTSFLNDGTIRVISAVPEPSTFALFALAAIGVATRRSRRQS